MEVIVFCVSIGMIMLCLAFGLGYSIGRGSSNEPIPEIDEDAEMLANNLHLIIMTGGLLDDKEKEMVGRAADYILKLGERKDEGD